MTVVMRRRFVDHCTQAAIGTEMGVSKMQISRVLRNITGRLRLALSA